METNENETATVQNLWDTAKAALRGKYIAIQASLKRIEKSKMQFLYTAKGEIHSHPSLTQTNRKI